MGRVVRFHRRSTRPNRLPPRRPPSGRVRPLLFAMRPFVLAAILAGLWIGHDPALVEVPEFLSTEPEQVGAHFARCAPGRAPASACVIDGDTFRLGERRIRIIGIDTAETDARCPEEARLAEAATTELQRLLNLGPFEMVARRDEPTDKYGRELRSLRRKGPDGTPVSIAAQMRDGGFARRYLGGLRQGWC